MTDSQEPSYYEIALTNRQVVVAFVILLFCLMGTFLAGVWVGRGEAAGDGASSAAQEETAEIGDLEELDFFGAGPKEEDGPEGGAGAQAAPGQASRKAPPEDPVVQRNRRQAAERAAPPAERDLAGGEGPALDDGPDRPAAPPPDSPPPTRPPVTTRPDPPKQDDPPPAGGRPVEGPVVQVFSSSSREQAQAVVDRLTDGGQPAYLSPVDVEGQTMYRVRIGPFRDRAQAERVAEQVKRAYRLDTWITQ